MTIHKRENGTLSGTYFQLLSSTGQVTVDAGAGDIDPYLRIEGGEFGTRDLRVVHGDGGNAVPIRVGHRTRGTRALPTAALAGDVLQQIGASGNPDGQFAGRAVIRWVARENFTALARGEEVELYVVPNGATGDVLVLVLSNSAAADDVGIKVRDVSAAAVKQVSRGAVDSGGVGFRALRIAN